MALEVVFEGSNIGCARLGVVHDGEGEFLVMHLEPEQFGHIAKNRL